MRSRFSNILGFAFLFTFLSASTAFAQDEDVPDLDVQENTPFFSPMQEVLACKMGKNGEHTLRILRRLNLIGSEYIYYMQRDFGPLEFYSDLGESKTASLRDREFYSSFYYAFISCQGQGENIFVMTTPPPMGRLLRTYFVRYNSDSEEWEDFIIGAMSHPEFVYMNKDEVLGFAQNGPQDRDKPDQIYQMQGYVAKKGLKFEYEVPIATLPPKKGNQVIPLKVQVQLQGIKEPKYFDE